MLGERALYYAIQQYLAHYHHERNHQGLDNQLIAQEGAVGLQTGHVVQRERLGGLLSYYHREAAWRDAVFQPYAITIVQNVPIENSSAEMIRYDLSLIPEAFKFVWAHVVAPQLTVVTSTIA